MFSLGSHAAPLKLQAQAQAHAQAHAQAQLASNSIIPNLTHDRSESAAAATLPASLPHIWPGSLTPRSPIPPIVELASLDIDMEVDQEQGDVSMDNAGEISDSSAKQAGEAKGAVLKILDQTIHDGGAVKYTVLWENGETTEVRQICYTQRTLVEHRGST